MNDILSVQRKEKGSNTKYSVRCHKVVKLYNSDMCGSWADLMEHHNAAYLLDRKSSVRFCLRIFLDLMDIECANSYLTYDMKHSTKLCLLDYKIGITKNLI